MTINPNLTPFNISQELLEIYSPTVIQDWLKLMNLSISGEFYMVDCYRRKIFVHSPKSKVLCGFPEKLLEQEGLDFFRNVVKPDDVDWLMKMYKSADELLFATPKTQRKKVEIIYDMAVTRRDGEELLVHHKVVPFQFCANDNVWLAFCASSLSSSTTERNAYFVNRETGKAFEFKDGRHVPLKFFGITPEEETILEMMLKNLQDKEMAEALGIPVPTFNSKKKRILSKLNTTTPAAAVHQAHLWGML